MMGHRALVARERDDGRYDCYYSHWGGTDVSLAGRLDRKPWTHDLVDPSPVATDVSWDTILADHFDALVYEAMYVLPADRDARAYRSCWLGPLADRGLLVAVATDDPGDDGYVRGWLDGARDALAACVERGLLDPATAHSTIETELPARMGDREVIWVDP